MNATAALSNLSPSPASRPKSVPSPERTLRRLFLTLFLRGRSARGLQKSKAPTSIVRKLLGTLLFYALFGCLAVLFANQSVFVLSAYLHAMTFVFLGMFVATSAGEILFNKVEADILLHRPIAPRSLLWAKVRVLVEISLYLSVAFNLAGFFVGAMVADGGWRFPFAHFFSIMLEAMFCTACVVMIYQLCLRWFGRERLDGLMTGAQVIVSVAAVLSGQILPQLFRTDVLHTTGQMPWWLGLLPPAWFAGLDDALAGSGAQTSWLLATLAVLATTIVLWISFGKLARDYETGLQLLNETVSTRKASRAGRRWLTTLVDMPPLRWWLRDPVSRASFLLSAAYLVRDRETKLRIYPGVAPMLMMPVIFLLQGRMHEGLADSGFGVAFAGGYIGLVPLLGLIMLQYSQQWQASDVFRAAPIPGPAPLCHGARRAMLCFLVLPVLVVFAVFALLVHAESSQLLLLLPGAITVPIFALVPNLGGRAVPLSLPSDEAKSTRRGLLMIAVMPVSLGLSALATFSWMGGWFWWLILVETILVIFVYAVMRFLISRARWPSLE